MTKKFANEDYKLACTQPYPWICKAQDIRAVADHLWNIFLQQLESLKNGYRYPEQLFAAGRVAMMLYGITIENMIKAALVSKGLAIDKNGNFCQKSHDLAILVQNFDITLSKAESELLYRLQDYIEWASRYPIPLYKDGLYPREFSNGNCGPHHMSLSSDEAIHINALIDKIQSFLPTQYEAMESYKKASQA